MGLSKIVVVSPHLDDGIFSTGDMLATESNAAVVTIFSGIPRMDTATEYDKATGFTTSQQAMRSRRDEDIQAAHHLGVEFVHFDYLDSQYSDESYDFEDMYKRLELFLKDADVIYSPVGLKHPDHQITRELVLSYMQKNPQKVYFMYEEMPYWVMNPNEAAGVLKEISEVFNVSFEYMNPRKLTSAKIFAVNRYKSQINTGDISPYTLLVPERHWRIINETN